jgi:hypothetical protein
MGEHSSPAAMHLCRNSVASQKLPDTIAPSASARRNPRYSLRVPISTAPTAGAAAAAKMEALLAIRRTGRKKKRKGR